MGGTNEPRRNADAKNSERKTMKRRRWIEEGEWNRIVLPEGKRRGGEVKDREEDGEKEGGGKKRR